MTDVGEAASWVTADERGLHLRVEDLRAPVWHPRRPWVALVHGQDGDLWRWVLDVERACALAPARVEGRPLAVAWVDDESLACVTQRADGLHVELRAVPDGGTIASARLPGLLHAPVELTWLPAPRRLVVCAATGDVRGIARALVVFDEALRVVHRKEGADVAPASAWTPHSPVVLDPDGRTFALWQGRGHGPGPTHLSALIAPLDGAGRPRKVAVEGMWAGDPRGRTFSGEPVVHGARWVSAEQVDFYSRQHVARIDPQRGRCFVGPNDNELEWNHERDEVFCRELGDANGRRATLCLAITRWGPMTPSHIWGVKLGEGGDRTGWVFPWGWTGREEGPLVLLWQATFADGVLGLLTDDGDRGGDITVARLVDLRAGLDATRVAEVATFRGSGLRVTLSADARWLLASALYDQREEIRVFDTSEVVWAPLAP